MGKEVIAVLFIVPVVLLFIVFIAIDMSEQIYIFNDRPMRHKEQRIAAVLPYLKGDKDKEIDKMLRSNAYLRQCEQRAKIDMLTGNQTQDHINKLEKELGIK